MHDPSTAQIRHHAPESVAPQPPTAEWTEMSSLSFSVREFSESGMLAVGGLRMHRVRLGGLGLAWMIR
jgi:hypothetical protein